MLLNINKLRIFIYISKKWYEKTPLGRKRLRMIRTIQEDTGKKGKKGVKGKKTRGKKK